MNPRVRRLAQFGLMVALILVLGLIDRAVPLSGLMSGMVPGLKLGLANTVLLYAVYLMDWKASVLLMAAKVILSGFLFGSLSAMLYSFCGGALSLAVMLLAHRNPKWGALGTAVAALASDGYLWMRHPAPKGQMLVCMILILIAGLAALGIFIWLRRRPEAGIIGVSLAGAVAHNLGQVLAASLALHTPLLLTVYLPVLAGLGAAVGCLTGIIAQRVLHAMKRL